MPDLDRKAIGVRIRQIRRRAGLRQWEMANLLRISQSAVHKYERGVMPEPVRLLALAKIGGTSMEWILTGKHWEDGATAQERISIRVLDAARALCEIDEHGAVHEALRVLQAAIRGLDEARASAVSTVLRSDGEQTAELLDAAWHVYRSVHRRMAGDARRRFARLASDSEERAS